MNDTAWQKARAAAGLGDPPVHDSRHTVGMRFRELEMLDRTISHALWHQSGNVTRLDTQAQEICGAHERIAQERIEHKNQALTGLTKAAQRARVASGSLRRTQQRKTG
jgi:integrase